MRILGIDPGYGRCGYAVVDAGQLVSCGIITTPSIDYFPQRLQELGEDFESILEKYQPQIAGIESQFFMQNVTTGLKLAQARGVMLFLCAKHGIKVIEPSPKEVKAAFTGDGNATKAQMRQMAERTYGHRAKIDDSADAMAVAWYVGQVGKLI
jgi:crossover junction endodeoxyribonuclease RuvC